MLPCYKLPSFIILWPAVSKRLGTPVIQRKSTATSLNCIINNFFSKCSCHKIKPNQESQNLKLEGNLPYKYLS